MEDNGNGSQEQDFITVFGARLDKSVRGTINSVKKLMSNIDDSKNIRFTSDAKFNKQFIDSVKNWNTISKKYAKTSLLSKVFGDKRAYADANRMFNKLKGKAGQIQTTYNERLNKLLGNNVENDFTKGQFGDILKGIGDNDTKLEELSTQLDELVAKRNELIENQKNIELFPDEKNVIAEQETLKTSLKQLQTLRDQISEQEFKPLGSTNKFTQARQDVMLMNKELSKLAITQYNRTGKDTLFKELKTDIQNTIKEHKQNLTDISTTLNNLRDQQSLMTKQYNEQLKAFANNPNSVNQDTLNDTENKLEDIKQQIQSLTDQRYKVAIQLELDKKRMNQYTQYYKKRGDNSVGFAENPKHTTQELQPKFDAAMRKLHSKDDDFTDQTNKLTFLEDLKNLDVQIDNTKSKISALGKSLHKIGEIQGNKQNIVQQLEETEQQIKDNERQQREVTTQTDKLQNALNNVLNEVKNIADEWGKLKNDLGNDPFKTTLTNEQLKTTNNEINQLNLKYGTFKNTIAKAFDFFKKSNVITRVFRRILINIRSQIASLLNPLNLWRKGWNDWLDRFENAQLKNTFEMIKYNLVTAFEPLFEMAAQVLLKLTQIANIFTKKLAGIDLFDGTDWKKNKRELDGITSSLDELHDIGKEQFFTGIADGFKGLWDGLSGFVKEHPILSAGLGLLFGTKFGRGIIFGVGKLAFKGIKSLFTGSAVEGAAEAGGSFLGKVFGSGLGTAIEGIGGAILLTTSTIFGAKATSELTYYWDKMSTGEKVLGGVKIAAGLAGNALGGAGLGAAIGSLGGPIGTVGGAILGFVIGAGADLISWASTSSAGILSVEDAQNNLNVATQNYDIAAYNAAQAGLQYNQCLTNLEQLERQTGQSGEELYKAVENGTLKVEDMTSAQLQVYSAYMQTKMAMEQLKQMQEELEKASKEKIQADLEERLSLANTSKSYGDFKKAVIDAIDSGKISLSEGRDYLERAMADMDDDARETFMEGIPSYISSGLDPNRHASAFKKFGDAVKNVFSNIGKSISNWWNNLWGNNKKEDVDGNFSTGGGRSEEAGGRFRWKRLI